jgi:DNA polymerase-1
MDIFPRLNDKQKWTFVRDAVVPRLNEKYGVYVQDKGGEWHFSIEQFAAYLQRERLIEFWPRLESGKLNLRTKTFEDMCEAWPQLEELRQLKYIRDKLRRIKLSVGSDGRNRTVLWPFQSKTSRSQPKAARWIFSPAVWLRSLIKPGPGRAVAYIDYSAMEFQLAAVLSQCKPMLELYASGEPYLGFAKRFDMVPQSATKATHPEVRDVYKTVLLGTQYGMFAATLARRLNISQFRAHEMLNQHRSLCSKYWAWSDDWLAYALDVGVMRTAFGWTCRTGITELSERSLRNWPLQTTGADILRIAAILMERRGIELLATIHDAVLIEAPIERIEADVALAQEIMRRASHIVLNAEPDGPYELRTDATIVRYPDRYVDKRGVAMWARVMELLDLYQEQEQREKADATG